VARPGLEPGTPRFSVVRVVRPRMAESLEVMRFRPGTPRSPDVAVCGCLSPVVGMAGASTPNCDSRCAGKNRGPLELGTDPLGRGHSPSDDAGTSWAPTPTTASSRSESSRASVSVPALLANRSLIVVWAGGDAGAGASLPGQSGAPRRARASAGLDVVVVVEGVVGVVRGLDFGESAIDVIAVGLSNPAGVVVGIKEVDVDAARAVRFEGLE
jgi:hypothetical protein